jgi:hypothetical protein
MSSAPQSTEQLQRWMQTVITHYGGVAAGVESDEARAAIAVESGGLQSVILPSQSQSSLERLAVYGNAYYARLLGCLRDLFPACRQAVGEEAFDEFAYGYLQSFPPRGYTLGTLANRFVQFLEESRREYFGTAGEDETDTDEVSAAEVEAWSRFVVELARLEFTVDEVFDGPGIEDMPPRISDELLAVPRDQWPSIRLVPAPCLQVLAFDFPVNAYFTAFRRGESPELPSAERSYLAVTRQEYVVRRYGLDSAQHALLAAIVTGATIGDAIAAAAAETADLEALLPRVSKWFSRWARAQFFVRLETSSVCRAIHGGITA